MHIVLDTKNEIITQKILQFLSSFSKDEIEIQAPKEIQKSFSEFSGMWKDREVTIESLRKEAWRK